MRRALIGALALLAAVPAVASAHAQLDGTSPSRGALVKQQPAQVVFSFSETVEAPPQAVRVFDAKEQRVDDGHVEHPGGTGSRLGVGLKPGLPDGTYVATYRVISADGHPVSGGLVFSVGKRGAGLAKPLDQLIAAPHVSTATKATQRVANALVYLATALTAGFVAFVLLCWGTGLQAPRARALLLGAALLGVAATVAGIVAEGKLAGGTSFVVQHTRFGHIWAARGAVFVVFGALVAARAGPRALAVPAALLVVAPALEGHSTTISPTGALVPLDVLHVLAMSFWLGGLIALLFVVTGDRKAILARFSRLALWAVVTLAVTGSVAAIAVLTKLDQLWNVAYGRELLAKIALLVVLIGLGALNRRRLAAGRTIRDVVRVEVVLILGVLGVSGVLVDGVPPVSTAAGPFSGDKDFGPIHLELTVDPARAGVNELHLYLLDVKTLAPFTRTKELTVSARLPKKQIGPLPLTLRRAGPGHYTADSLQLLPAGTWSLNVSDRVSDFDEYTTTLEVPIR